MSQRLVRAKSRLMNGDNLDKLWLTWGSATDNKCGPKCIARDVNPFLNHDHSLWADGWKDYIDVGIVVLDFPTTWTPSLPTKIYQRNFKGMLLLKHAIFYQCVLIQICGSQCVPSYTNSTTMVEPSSLCVKVKLDQIQKTFTFSTGVTRSLLTGTENLVFFDSMFSYLFFLRLKPKCTLTYWEHANYKGAGRRVTELRGKAYRKKTLGATWNDRISSLKCTCPLPTAPFLGKNSSPIFATSSLNLPAHRKYVSVQLM